MPPREVRPEVSLDTSVAVMKGLAVHPEQRPASVEAFSTLLGSTHTATTPQEALTQTVPSTSPSKDSADPPSVAEAPSPPSDAPSTDRSTLSPLLLGLGVVGLVGASLALSDTSAVEVLAFFGTWVAVCFGLVGLFREGEKVMSSEGRAAVSDWLLRENFAHRHSNWPETFVDLFDAVFTERHLSWSCFWRSAVTSTFVVSLLLTGFIGFGLLEDFAPDSITDVSAFAFLGIPIVLNVGIDYVSLFETRWILGKMSTTDRGSAHLGYLGVDLLLTVLCVLLPVAGVQVVTSMPLDEAAVWSTDFWEEIVQLLILLGEWLLRFHEDDARLLSVMFFSTLFTSVWVWLYVAAGLLLRAVHPVLESLDWLKAHLDVETRPLHTMGLLLALITSVAFAVSAPLVL